MKRAFRAIFRAPSSQPREEENPPNRPDISELIGPRFDVPNIRKARKTLIICAAPRTGSHELSRLLLAAGIGVPHEYFNPRYAQKIAGRWGLEGNPLGESHLGAYIQTLRKRRSKNGVFVFKMQFWMFDEFLCNAHGARLFKNASLVHLFRPDISRQFVSLRKAQISGRWDFSDYVSTIPKNDSLGSALSSLDRLVAEDASLRRLFALLGTCPLLITTDELAAHPSAMVRRIADLVGVPVDQAALEATLTNSAPYPNRQVPDKEVIGANGSLRHIAFQKRKK